jgi:hypothetical protein
MDFGTFPQMLSSVKEKWCLFHCGMFSIIVAELCNRKPFIPIVLTLIDEDTKILFDVLVHLFHLSIGDQMEGSGSVLFDTQKIEQGLDVFVDESCVMIMYDLLRKSMIMEDLILKGLGKSFCSKFYMRGFEFDIFGKSINDDKNSIIPIGHWKWSEEIKCNDLPRLGWSLMRM